MQKQNWCLILVVVSLLRKGDRCCLRLKSLLGKVDEEDSKAGKASILDVNTVLTCRKGKSKKTEPPKPYTEASLLQAMTGIARFVEDKELKKILRETDGLGTEATRAGILDTLFRRQLLARSGKVINSTPAGRGLIHALPRNQHYRYDRKLGISTSRHGRAQPSISSFYAGIRRYLIN